MEDSVSLGSYVWVGDAWLASPVPLVVLAALGSFEIKFAMNQKSPMLTCPLFVDKCRVCWTSPGSRQLKLLAAINSSGNTFLWFCFVLLFCLSSVGVESRGYLLRGKLLGLLSVDYSRSSLSLGHSNHDAVISALFRYRSRLFLAVQFVLAGTFDTGDEDAFASGARAASSMDSITLGAFWYTKVQVSHPVPALLLIFTLHLVNYGATQCGPSVL